MTWTLDSLQFTPIKDKIKPGNCLFNEILGAKCLSMSLKRHKSRSTCKKCKVLASEMA